jgi:hypothetical protein
MHLTSAYIPEKVFYPFAPYAFTLLRSEPRTPARPGALVGGRRDEAYKGTPAEGTGQARAGAGWRMAGCPRT